MPCDALDLTDEERDAQIDWEHGGYPGCPYPYSPALGAILPENLLVWTIYQQGKLIGWETVWQLTSLTLTIAEADTLRDLLAFLTVEEQTLRAAQADQQQTRG